VQQLLTWIGVLLRDFNGEPIANQDFTIALANGQVLTGSTDAQGHARFDGIQPGSGDVTFHSIPDDEAVVARQETEDEQTHRERRSRAAPGGDVGQPEPDEPMHRAPEPPLPNDGFSDEAEEGAP
jgi:hypothetical protein